MTRAAFWLLAAVTLAVYATMIFWSIPRLVEAAGGLAIFDMRPGGYGPEEAREVRRALGPGDVAFYRDVQLRLDAVYPALMAATLGIALHRLWRPVSGGLAWALVAAAIAGAACDYGENLGIARMLEQGADAVSDALIGRTSLASQGKAALTTVAMLGLVAGLVRLGWRRLRGER